MTKGEKRAGGGKDRNSDKSSKRRKFFTATKTAALPLRSRGFLVTCTGGKEYQAANDALRLINQAYEALKPGAKAAVDAHPVEDTGNSVDLAKELAEEVAELKQKSNELFTYHKTGVGALVYISMRDDLEGPSPSELVNHIADSVREAKHCQSRFLMRVLPVESVCHASMEAIGKLANELLPRHFPAGCDASPLSYAVQYEHRASGGLDRGKLIDTIVAPIDKVHKVNLNTPDRTIIVQVVKMCCAMSVVERYKENLKFNLRELGLTDEEREAAAPKHSSNKEAAVTPSDVASDARPKTSNGAHDAGDKPCAGESAAAGPGSGPENGSHLPAEGPEAVGTAVEDTLTEVAGNEGAVGEGQKDEGGGKAEVAA